MPDKKEYQKQLDDLILDGLLIINGYGRLGVQDVLKSDANAVGESLEFAEIEVEIDNEILSPKDAIIALENMLGLKQGSIYETILQSGDIDKLVSLISGNSYDDFVTYINNKASETLKAGGNYVDWYQSLVAENKADTFTKTGYWATVWRTNSTSLYNIGMLSESDRLKEFIKYGEFISVLDSSTTEICTALDGKIKTMAEWKKGFVPALHYNCRSFIAIISKYRAEAENINKTPLTFFSDLKNRGVKPAKGFGKALSVDNIIKAID